MAYKNITLTSSEILFTPLNSAILPFMALRRTILSAVRQLKGPKGPTVFCLGDKLAVAFSALAGSSMAHFQKMEVTVWKIRAKGIGQFGLQEH